MNNTGDVKKICSFSVSDWHFITTVIPYIDKKIKENENIEIFLENDFTKIINTFLSKINLDIKTKNKIENLNWYKKNYNKYDEFKTFFKCKKLKNIFIVKGSNQYINKLNSFLKYFISKNQVQEITIVNCYDVSESNQDIKNILENHEKILNTSGEKNIEDVFTNYDIKRAL